MALLVGALSNQRLRSRQFLSFYIETLLLQNSRLLDTKGYSGIVVTSHQILTPLPLCHGRTIVVVLLKPCCSQIGEVDIFAFLSALMVVLEEYTSNSYQKRTPCVVLDRLNSHF